MNGLYGKRPKSQGLFDLGGALFPPNITPFDVGLAAPHTLPQLPLGFAFPRSLMGGARRRTRSEWNERFSHWEKPASPTEEGSLERARKNVLNAIKDNAWLVDQGVVIEAQGSYSNNTNVRTEADIDLRAVHPALLVEYHQNVLIDAVNSVVRYGNSELSYDQIFQKMKYEINRSLSAKFGSGSIKCGSKAIAISGITGGSAKVDVVPSVGYHFIKWDTSVQRYEITQGIALLPRGGSWIVNFPEQHLKNGVEKRARTAHRFKRMVRIFKRLRTDMVNNGVVLSETPSFLVESLVYTVEDGYFLVESDDAYARVQRIARRMLALLTTEGAQASMTEINEMKLLFHQSQAWRYSQALDFARAVVRHLGDA